jgi:hypothetical protein
MPFVEEYKLSHSAVQATAQKNTVFTDQQWTLKNTQKTDYWYVEQSSRQNTNESRGREPSLKSTWLFIWLIAFLKGTHFQLVQRVPWTVCSYSAGTDTYLSSTSWYRAFFDGIYLFRCYSTWLFCWYRPCWKVLIYSAGTEPSVTALSYSVGTAFPWTARSHAAGPEIPCCLKIRGFIAVWRPGWCSRYSESLRARQSGVQNPYPSRPTAKSIHSPIQCVSGLFLS